MKRTMRGVLLVATLTAGAAAGVTGQDTPAEPAGARSIPGVEAIIRMRERLELSETQVADLDAIRRESVERRSAAAAELTELRSQLAAGLIDRSDVMAFLEQKRDGDRQYATERKARVEALLDEAQLESLQELRQRRRAFARGRMGLRRGGQPGFRGRRPGVRGGRPGVRGPRRRGPLVREGRFWRRGRPALGLGPRLSWRS